jgi:GNAT superfamily N-acetyltransferase
MTLFVARNDPDEIIGTIGGASRGAEGHIRGMAMLPSAQGTGVADQLLQAIERYLAEAGCSFVTLDRTGPLTRAVRFYERHGYARSGVISDFSGCHSTSTGNNSYRCSRSSLAGRCAMTTLRFSA